MFISVLSLRSHPILNVLLFPSSLLRWLGIRMLLLVIFLGISCQVNLKLFDETTWFQIILIKSGERSFFSIILIQANSLERISFDMSSTLIFSDKLLIFISDIFLDLIEINGNKNIVLECLKFILKWCFLLFELCFFFHFDKIGKIALDMFDSFNKFLLIFFWVLSHLFVFFDFWKDLVLENHLKLNVDCFQLLYCFL